MKSIGAKVLRPDALPGVSSQYNILVGHQPISCTKLCVKFLHKTTTLIYSVNPPLVASYDIPGTW